jgi:hypothetical protein
MNLASYHCSTPLKGQPGVYQQKKGRMGVWPHTALLFFVLPAMISRVLNALFGCHV